MEFDQLLFPGNQMWLLSFVSQSLYAIYQASHSTIYIVTVTIKQYVSIVMKWLRVKEQKIVKYSAKVLAYLHLPRISHEKNLYFCHLLVLYSQ